MTEIKVKKGDTFRSVIADCNALWRVESVSGGIAHCVVVNEPWEHNGHTYDSDYAGHRKPFYVQDVKSAIAMAQMWEQRANEQDEFYASLVPGQIVHYNNGFGEFVRCEVIVLDEDLRSGPSEYKAGDTVLQPVALVGAWKEYDLPHTRLDEDGVEREVIPYHARKVIERSGAWRASDSCVFEAPGYSSSYKRQGDPTTMEPIDLTVRVVA